jgi:hypothetical protein
VQQFYELAIYEIWRALGNENVKFLCIKTSDYEKMHLYEVEKKQRTPL